jgi:catechol 2,3-dioxygenase
MAIQPQITHVGLNSPNLEAMEKFYTEVMGLKVTDRGTVARLGGVKIVFMSANPENHHQVVLIESKAPSNVQQLSFKVDALADLRVMRDRLAAAGAPITPIDHGNAWSVYSADPDGNGVEVYLDSPWQVAQPHGLPLDLSRSDDEIVAGTRARIEKEPTFQPVDRWKEAFLRRLQ